MSNNKNLGRLDRVDLREAWESESGDFTPWLAKEENLALLGEAIGIELECEAQEKSVGPFRADILCKDATNGWVLIENQLERTDHCHLGQLLTYAAGLKAVTIVWIAEQFTEEHRAALGWLNDITEEGVNFFGLEIELWRIGSSPIAPKFNIACQPNEWSKQASDAAAGELTEMKLLQREYWAALRKLLMDRGSPVVLYKPQPQHWTECSIGRSGFGLSAAMNTLKGFIRVQLYCQGNDAKTHFAMLQQDKAAIEQAIGCPLEWREKPNRRSAAIALVRSNVAPTSRDDWPTQHAWLAEKLEAFHMAFASRIKQLDFEEETEAEDE
ncbi:MAG: DUF4268 domain-containing protein [Planctomycetaceae bacterium]|nr:DUF4268 domain-containing protein [Planctomycetaceae bacterium]